MKKQTSAAPSKAHIRPKKCPVCQTRCGWWQEGKYIYCPNPTHRHGKAPLDEKGNARRHVAGRDNDFGGCHYCKLVHAAPTIKSPSIRKLKKPRKTDASQPEGDGTFGETFKEWQPFKADRRCPNCGGYPGLPRGEGVRCVGFHERTGRAFYCSREAKSRGCERGPIGTLRHVYDEECSCGKRHVRPEHVPKPRLTDGDTKMGEKLTRLAENTVRFFFVDQFGTSCVTLPVDGHIETWPVRTERFKEWLAKLYRDNYQKTPGKSAGEEARLQVCAICEESKVHLHNRVGLWQIADREVILYDLADAEWRHLYRDCYGRRQVDHYGSFRRTAHHEAQVMPAPQGEGDAKKLLEFVNVREQDQCVFMVAVASLFVPEIPHPVINLVGRAGTGKTTAARMIRDIVDPSKTRPSGLPLAENDLDVALSKNWLSIFDNVSHLKAWQSDLLCRCVTGGGTQIRKLYTDDEEHLRSYQHCVVLASIGNTVVRDDLLDRTITIELPRIKKRRDEKRLWRDWREALPSILGGFLDAVFGAVELLEDEPADLQRMGDFDRWGRALAPGLGYTAEEFKAAYHGAVKDQVTKAAALDPFVAALTKLVEIEGRRWKGSPTALHEALQYPMDVACPKNPRAVSVALTRSEDMLAALGIVVQRVGTKTKPIIVLRRRDI